MPLPEQPAKTFQKLRSVEVTLNSQQLLWLMEEFGEEVNPAEGLVRLVNRTMAAQYRSRLRKASDGVTVVQLPSKAAAPQPVPATPARPVAQTPSPPAELGNPVGVLQEHCQKQRYPLPDYQFSPSAQGFQCEVTALGHREIGVGASKSAAKHQAAQQLLAQLKGGF